MKPNKYITLSLALFVAGVTTLSAHRTWINPSSTILSREGTWVTFDACSSNDIFYANHHSLDLEGFKIYGPDGKVIDLVNPHEGEIKSTFDLQLNRKGTYLIQSERTYSGAFYKEGEKRKRWSGTLEEFKKSEIAKKEGIKFSVSSSKNVTFVSLGEPSKEVLKASGKGLELVFTKSHPNDLVDDEVATFILHQDGKTVANQEVTVIKAGSRYQDKPTEIKIKTNDKGECIIKWAGPGKYWLNTRVTGAETKVDGVNVSNRASYTVTFEVMPS